MKGEQLPLSMQLRNVASFETYHAGANAAAVEALRAAPGRTHGRIYLYGPRGVGKTHLLQAAAREALGRAQRAAYLPLTSLIDLGADALTGLDALDLLCLDDLDAICGDHDWALALIRLLDGLRLNQACWIASAATAPDRLACALPDLRTRLSSAGLYGLRTLDDEERRQWLHQAARARGLELPEDAASWLVNRLPRDAPSLLGAIDQLDQASLRAKRRLTLAFVQQTLKPGDRFIDRS